MLRTACFIHAPLTPPVDDWTDFGVVHRLSPGHDLNALGGGILVYTSGVEWDDVARPVRHGGDRSVDVGDVLAPIEHGWAQC